MIPPFNQIKEEILQTESSQTLRGWLCTHGYTQICGDIFRKDKRGIEYTIITETSKWRFCIDYEWGISLIRTNNPGYSIREVYFLKNNEEHPHYKLRLPNGYLKEVI